MVTKNGSTVAEQAEEAPPAKAIELTPLRTAVAVITIEGVTPLIVNRWSEKAREMMNAAQQGRARVKKPPKDPEADFQASRYLLPDGRDAFPARAFKAAMVNACSQFDGITKVLTKQAIFIGGIGPDMLIPIEGEVSMREDQVRNATGVADVRFRAQISNWVATLNITYVSSALSQSTIVSLLDAAGFGGVGDWRPSAPKSASGTYGMFKVRRDV